MRARSAGVISHAGKRPSFGSRYLSRWRRGTAGCFSPRAWKRWPFAFVRAFDRPLKGERLPGASSVGQWLSARGASHPPAPADQAMTIHAERLAAWEKQTAPLARLPRLIAGADLAAAFARTAWRGMPRSR